jgi:hypothetical protein
VAADRKGGTEDTIKKAEKLGKQIILVKQKCPKCPICDTELSPDLNCPRCLNLIP